MCYNPKTPCECLSTGSLCDPCKMTAKDREMEETHFPNISSTGRPRSTSKLELTPSATEVVREKGRNWGWMLSGIICLNILMLGCCLVSGSTSQSVNIDFQDLHVFLIILILFTSIWMIYYTIYTIKNQNAVNYKDEHAGPIWLKGGLVLFGILSIIMDIFKIAGYVGYLHCDSAVKVAFPVVQLVFVLVQTYFLWVHSKDCVQRQRNLARCGLMLTLSTNLLIWMTEVTEESLHQTIIPEYPTNVTKLSRRSLYINRAGYGDDSCKCSHTSCSFFKEAYYYLYPFNIEYCLFASAMSYIMWKNVGRVSAEFSHHVKFSLKGILIGPILGIVMVVAGLATFAMYEIEMKTNYNDKESSDHAVMMHFVMNIVIVTLMSICSIIGCAIYKVDHREHSTEKNPTRSLDIGLLVGSSLGQFIISYFSIVAMVATGAKGYLNRLNLAWGLLMVMQLGLQNYFIVEGLHREPFHEVEPDRVVVVVNPYVMKSNNAENNIEKGETEKKADPEAEAQCHGGAAEHHHKLLWKRRVLREVCAFLLLGNVILWIMPAFGARPQFDHDTETNFYQFTMWAAIVNVGLPFGIFYRMHSVASLFEVFLNS
ncbi:proton channel OTOP2 [Kryptolebias marmoratus]|uniref:Otopetrin 2 n=1 Tax=Kryptolebias marmoratus TaxID=37003 RepID=A0A3Q3ATC7_KRYMA|nr:proton channel OTOP2 [Kryptolebias marmoratus]